ncbi:MAG: AAA family ATPase [Thermoplasmata archaeon]
MPSTRSEVLRALEGLTEHSGRTLVIEGPPMCGKSRLLREIRTAVAARGGRVVELRGTYRGRTVPFGGLDGLRSGSEPPVEDRMMDEGEDEPLFEASADAPMAPVVYDPERLPRSRRGRTERPRTTFLGQPIRSRSANEGDADAYWSEILPEFRGADAHAVLIAIDDAALFDSESREFIAALSRRARLRPLLIAITLDTTVPDSTLWQEALLGRGDVDWVRLTETAPDPRETHRLKAVFDDLPGATQRVAGTIALLGGEVNEVVLSRVSRLGFGRLGEVLVPATEVGLVKVVDGKVTMPRRAWIPILPDLLPEETRRSIHLEIAEALGALSSGPEASREGQIARHYLAAGPGPTAMVHLLEAADLSQRLLSYDSAAGLLEDAVGCLNSILPAERQNIEPEVRLLYARALFFSGRFSEAEVQVREGFDGALRAGTSATDLAEWVEPLLVAMRVAGPRPSLTTTLVDLAERCHDASLTEVEVLLETLIADFYRDRNLIDRARAEALRAAQLAHALPERHLQAVGLLTMAFVGIEGTAAEQSQAERYLRAARYLLGSARRRELDFIAGEFEARLYEARGEIDRARVVREQSITALQRERLLSIELYHVLGLAEILLDRAAPAAYEAHLARARTIVETLHLLPPSPGLLKFWLLDGRQYAKAENLDAARDRWEAISDLPPTSAIPRIRAEAIARLALLDLTVDKAEEAETLTSLLKSPEQGGALPKAWAPWLTHFAELAPKMEHGGGRLPARPSESRGERGERRRGKAVRNR